MAVLGNSAFLFAGTSPRLEGAVYLDRPDGRGFSLRKLGGESGWLSANRGDAADVARGGIRIGDRVGVMDEGRVRLYDERGSVEMTAQAGCTNALAALSSTTLYLRCDDTHGHSIVSAFPRPYHR